MASTVRALKSASGLTPSSAEANCLQQVLLRALQRLGHQLLDAVLHGDGAAVGEQLVERLGQVPAARGRTPRRASGPSSSAAAFGALAELGLDALRDLLELGLHELGVGAGLLAVEHAGADLQGVGDHGVGIERLGDRAGASGLVGDDEAVDRDAGRPGGDVRMAKWGCGFHGLESQATPGPDGTGVRLQRTGAARQPVRRHDRRHMPG